VRTQRYSDVLKSELVKNVGQEQGIKEKQKNMEAKEL
jgi:hypothetical protein